MTQEKMRLVFFWAPLRGGLVLELDGVEIMIITPVFTSGARVALADRLEIRIELKSNGIREYEIVFNLLIRTSERGQHIFFSGLFSI